MKEDKKAPVTLTEAQTIAKKYADIRKRAREFELIEKICDYVGVLEHEKGWTREAILYFIENRREIWNWLY